MIIASSTFAQPQLPPDTLWTRTYGGQDDDFCYCVRLTSDSGYILGGYTFNFGANHSDMYLLKVDSFGVFKWQRTFGGNFNEECIAVRQTVDDGYILGGYTATFGAGGLDMYLVKTDSSGDTEWQRTYGGIGDDYCSSLQQTADGGYILTGRTTSFGAGMDDAYLVKVDSLGHSEWERTYGSAQNDKYYDVQLTADGGYIMGGSTYYNGPEVGNMYLVKTDSLGDIIWERTYGGDNWERCESLQITTDGGYILGGNTWSFGAGQYDMYIVKTDSLGYEQWYRTFGGEFYERCHSIQQTFDGGYIVGGFSATFGAGNDDMYVVKTDSLGETEWEQTFGGIRSEKCYSVQQLPDSGYIIGGYSESFSIGAKDIYLVRQMGESQTGISQRNTLTPRTITLSQNYPNPFNSETIIPFTLQSETPISVRIFNIFGQEVATLYDGIMPPGPQSVNWRAAGAAASVYFYRLEIPGSALTGKCLLLK